MGKCYQNQDWRHPHHGCDTIMILKRSGEEKLLKLPVIMKVKFFSRWAREKIKGRKRGLISWWLEATWISLNAKNCFKKLTAQKVGCHSMSSLSPLSLWKDISARALPSSSRLSHYRFHWRERGIFPATDLSAVRSSFRVGCGEHAAQIVPYLIVMLWVRNLQHLPNFSLPACTACELPSPLQSSSLLANLAKSFVIFKIILTSSPPWSIPWSSQGKLVYSFSPKTRSLVCITTSAI